MSNNSDKNKEAKNKSEILWNLLMGNLLSYNSRFNKKQRHQEIIWIHCRNGSLMFGKHDGS